MTGRASLESRPGNLTGTMIAALLIMGLPTPHRAAPQSPGPARPRNPCELEIDLFCKGVRIGQKALRQVRLARRTRAGLGSGLELILPGEPKPIWVNVPVTERFASHSPYALQESEGEFWLEDGRQGFRYPVEIAEIPAWYEKTTSHGVKMGEIGTLQGTYLGIYVGPVCRYWREPAENCKFCTTGLNVGPNEQVKKRIEDVLETCLAARRESGVTFVHFNSGYQAGQDLRVGRPYLRAVKQHTGLLAGIQMAPVSDFDQYDELIDLGADHFSFCFEFMNPRAFAELCPGKQRTLGQRAFFRAMEYTAGRLGKGRVSGEIIAGVEPIEDTFRAIDLITDCGAFPTICVFRPLQGSDMQHYPPPSYEDMRKVFQYMADKCIEKRIPVGVAPNIEVSLVVQPSDALYLAEPSSWAFRRYRLYNGLLTALARPVFRYRLWRGDRRSRNRPDREAEQSSSPMERQGATR